MTMDGLTCPHCGTVNPEDANFCKKCGANLHEDDAPAAATPDAPAAESRPPETLNSQLDQVGIETRGSLYIYSSN